MNTAQSHWNIESMKTYLDGRFETPIVNAAIVIALAAGLTSGDMAENIFREDGLDAIGSRRRSSPATRLLHEHRHWALRRRRCRTQRTDEVHNRFANQTGAPVLTMERSV